MANGMSFQDIVDEYPDLDVEDIQQALRFLKSPNSFQGDIFPMHW